MVVVVLLLVVACRLHNRAELIAVRADLFTPNASVNNKALGRDDNNNIVVRHASSSGTVWKYIPPPRLQVELRQQRLLRRLCAEEVVDCSILLIVSRDNTVLGLQSCVIILQRRIQGQRFPGQEASEDLK